MTHLTSFSEDMLARGLKPQAKILTFESVPASASVALTLDIRPGRDVLHIKRLRLADRRAVGVHDAYLRDVAITRDALEAAGSLYQRLEAQGVRLSEGEEVIEAVAATKELSRLLGVVSGAPLLQVTRTMLDDTKKPVEFVSATYRADLYRYTIRLKR